MEHVVRIYVHAPFEHCVNESMRIHPQMTRDEVTRYITRIDKERALYYKYFTGLDWKNADNYDLCLNSKELGWEKCVSLVKAYLEIKLS